MGVACVPGAGVVRAKGEISRTCARTRQGRKGVEASSSPLLPPAPATQAGWKWMCRSLAPCRFFVVKLKERLRIDCEQFLRIILSPEPVSILAGESWAQGSPRSQASPTKCMGQEARMNSRYPRRLDCLPINTTTTSLRCGRDFGWVEFLMFPRAAHFLLAVQFHLLSRGTQQENRALFVV